MKTKNGKKSEDKRPDPKPRKHPHLWQAYLWWNELMHMHKAHTLRLGSIEAGKSNLDGYFERIILDETFGVTDKEGVVSFVPLAEVMERARKSMAAHGEAVGPIWDWLVAIKGIGVHTAAKLLGLINDIEEFATVSKLWRFCGYAVIDGEIDRCKYGEKSPYNRRLKAECHLIAEQFVMQKTPIYSDIYYEEKERQLRKHPDPICSQCGAIAVQKGQRWVCSACKASGGKIDFTPAHLQNRAYRKVIKIFLQHLWVKWREFEGLPISEPYAKAVMGHTHIIPPP